MALPEGYFSDENDCEDDGLSFSYESPNMEVITVDENKKLNKGQQLINAILDRKLEEIEKLIEEGTDVNYCKGLSGWSPLMYASSLGISEYIDILLKKGADPNFHDKLTTALICLCSSTSFDVVELLKCLNLLIEGGASINVCDENKITPLMHAASKGHIPLVARLLELGSDLEMRDNDGWTAIYFAVNSGDTNMVQMLKDAGSKLTSVDSKGRSLFDLANSKNYHIIAEIVNMNKDELTEEKQKQLLQPRKMSKYELLMFDLPVYSVSDFNGFMEDTIRTIVATGLNNLVNIFMEKKIGYGQFLTFKDEDWKQIGIQMNYDRKKLIYFSKRIIGKTWSKEAFIKQLNGKFSLFQFIQCVSNSIRIVHILIATCYVCKRDSLETKDFQNDSKNMIQITTLLNECLRELQLLRADIKKLLAITEKIIIKFPTADFIG